MVRFWDSFAVNPANKADRRWDSVFNVLVTGPYGNGKGALPNTQNTKTLGANYTEFYTYFHYFTGTAPITGTIHSWLDGSTVQMDLRVDVTGSISLTRNGTLVGTASAGGVLAPNTLYNFCVHLKIDATAGIAECKVNGTMILNSGLTNLNTKNSSNAFFNVLKIQGAGNASIWWATYVFWDTVAGTGNDLTGYPASEMVFDPKGVTGAGSNAQWTPLSSTNASNVDDPIAGTDDDATYNSSATPNQIDDFAVGNLSATSGTIIGIGMTNVDRIDDATPRTVSHYLKSSAATFVGTAYSPGSTYKCNSIFVTLDPNTSAAPTVGGRNGMTFGYKEIT